jgi:hypothetical protein
VRDDIWVGMRRVFRASILGCADTSDTAPCDLSGRWVLFQLLSIHYSIVSLNGISQNVAALKFMV